MSIPSSTKLRPFQGFLSAHKFLYKCHQPTEIQVKYQPRWSCLSYKACYKQTYELCLSSLHQVTGMAVWLRSLAVYFTTTWSQFQSYSSILATVFFHCFNSIFCELNLVEGKISQSLWYVIGKIVSQQFDARTSGFYFSLRLAKALWADLKDGN